MDAKAGNNLKQAVRPKASIVIDAKNKLYLNGREIHVPRLAGELRRLLGDAGFDERVVLLKVHKEIQASRFEPVIEAVAAAGGKLVHVLEKWKEKQR